MSRSDDPSGHRHEAVQAALSRVQDLIYIYDEDLRLVYANQTFLDLFGTSLEELRGQYLRDFLQDEQTSDTVEPGLRHVLRTGETVQSTVHYTSPVGLSGHFEYIFRRYEHESGLWVVGSTRDISDRVRLSEELERKNEELTEILESITDAFYALDSEWRFTYLNRRAAQVLHRTREGLLGKRIWDEFPKTRETLIYPEFHRAMEKQTSSSFELYYEPLEIWFQVDAYPSNDVLSVYFRDITEQVQIRQELTANERRYRTLTNAMPQLVWLTDANGYHLYYNDRWYEFTGLTEEESLGFGFSNALHPADLDRTLREWERAWRDGHSYEIEYRFYSRHLDEYRWFLGRAFPVYDDDGEIVEWVGTCTDIHPQKQAEDQLRESERRLEEAQRIAQIGNWEYNVKTGDFSCSDQYQRIFGLVPGEEPCTMQDFSNAMHPEDRPMVREQRDRILEAGQGSYDIEYRIICPNGEERVLHALAELLPDEDGEPHRVFGTVHDITHRKEIEQSLEEYARQQAVMSRQLQHLNSTLEQQVEERTVELRRLSENLERMVWERTSDLEESREQLAHQARHDPLTGLPNRMLFEDRLEHTIARADRQNCMVGVLFIDLDGFKLVNDTYGHAFGDQVLKAVALRLQARLRRNDTLARHGGDEFVALLENVDAPEDAYVVAQDFLAAVAQPIVVAERAVRLSASIGAAFFPQDAKTVAALQRQADIAMYRAKLSGKNDVRFYSPSMNAAAEERLEIAAHLSSAMEDGELLLNFQPQWNLLTGRAESFEALLRWYNPELGSVAPSRLIPIAEESGLMAGIGNWVLDESCRQAAIWTELTGERIGVAVNISAAQFDRDDFVDTVSRVLDKHRLVPSQLELELAESTVIEDVDQATAKMAKLRTLGVRLALDDFGLGGSSLGSLVQLPLDTVKIDRAFIRDLPDERVADRVIQAIVSLASGIGLGVVAEGVETEAQRERVLELGCERLQGFLMGVPADADATKKLLKHSSRAGRFSDN